MPRLTDVGRCIEAAARLLEHRPAGLITDVDGTISEIAPRPDLATVHPRALSALGRLRSSLDLVALLSGRSVEQLRRMIDLEEISMVGNHGLEQWEGGRRVLRPETGPFIAQIGEAADWLRTAVEIPGVLIEDKELCVAVHYRQASDPVVARRQLMDLFAACPAARGLRLAEGKMVLELRPPLLVDKGTAVRDLVLGMKLSAVVYLGDDSTDIDAFRELEGLRRSGRCDVLSIAVDGADTPQDLASRADCLLEGVEAVAAFLGGLAARTRGSSMEA